MSKSKCKTCGKPYSKEEQALRALSHRQKVQLAFKKRQAAGKNVGRPVTTPRKEAVELRKQGLTLQKIAMRLKCSLVSVQRAVEAARANGEFEL